MFHTYLKSQHLRQHHHLVMSLPYSLSDAASPMLVDDDQEQEPDPEQEQESHDQSRRTEQRTQSSSSSLKEKEPNSTEESKKKREPNLEGLSCSICLEAWSSEGDHQVSCLPCGHLYGLSCIRTWLRRHAISAKCPQCNSKCTLNDVRKLYSVPVTALDEKLHKKLESLEAEIGSLRRERTDLLEKQGNLLNIQDNLLKELDKLKQKSICLENASIGEMGRKPFGYNIKEAQGYCYNSNLDRSEVRHCTFVLEHELAVEGARLFDLDTSYQNLILARRIAGMGGIHMLNKINLIDPHETEDIQLPPSTKAIKDIKISPCGRLSLLASLGKKLSVISMGSNKIVINHDLKVPAWSCSWDIDSPNCIYAGLQNGVLLVFDMRKIMNPLQSMIGPTRPVHTIHSLVHNPVLGQNCLNLLTACSSGLCVWDINTGGRPFWVPGLENQGTCTSLAYGSLSNDIVATYRPKFQASEEAFPDPASPEATAVTGHAVLGSQVLVKRVAGSFYHNMGSTSVYLGDVQLAKSAIIDMGNCFPLFAYGDQLTHSLRLRELPSLTVSQNLKPHHHPILDVKYAHTQDTGILGCVSEDKLQLFSAKVF